MKISNLFKFSSLCISFLFFSLSSIAFVMLIYNGLILLLIFPILACILKDTRVSKDFKKGFEIFPLLTFLFLLAVRADLFVVVSSLLLASISAKFVLSNDPKDYFEIFVVGLMLSLLSSIGTIAFGFGIVAIFFLISSFFFLIQTQFKNSIPLKKSAPDKKDIFIYIATSLLFSLILFFSLPRFTLGVIHGNPIGAKATSNFSEDVSIDSNPITLDYSIVMRIEKNKQNMPLYISGLRYTTFLNGKWYKSEQKEKVYPDLLGVFLERTMKKATIYLEPNNTNVIFMVDYARGIYGNFNLIYKDNIGNLFFETPFFKTVKYDSFFEDFPLKEKLSNEDLKRYLDVRGVNPQIIELANSISKNSSKQTDKLNAILNYLKTSNEYSLNPTARNIDDFMLNHASGYCEHFATAFVILARASNIPARLVSGFVTTEWNDTLKYYIVRAKDAHTWAEVYMNNAWVRIDPTPPSQTQVSKISLFADSIRMFWYKNFVTYNVESQVRLFSNIQETFTNFGKNTLNLVEVLRSNIYSVLIIGLLILVSSLIKKRKRNQIDIITKKIINLIGNDKSENETILEFAKRKRKDKELQILLNLYYEYRFGKKYWLKDAISKMIKDFQSQKSLLTN
ncbi:transglutaminase family protein [Caldisericum exile]